MSGVSYSKQDNMRAEVEAMTVNERDCNTCKHKDCWEAAEPCVSCKGGNRWEPQTIYDLITSYSPEALAEFLFNEQYEAIKSVFGEIDGLFESGFIKNVEAERDEIIKEKLEWLNQEVAR